MRPGAIFAELAWRQVDDGIVRALRAARRAVPTVDLPRVCSVSALCTPEQLRQSLERLERQRLIRRCTVTIRDPDAPLLGAATFDAYVAMEVRP
jgi:hypothetical protein